MSIETPDPLDQALIAARLFTLAPQTFGGMVLRGASPARDALVAALGAALPCRRLPGHVDDERLLGGIDIAASLAAGKPVETRGLLATFPTNRDLLFWSVPQRDAAFRALDRLSVLAKWRDGDKQAGAQLFTRHAEDHARLLVDVGHQALTRQHQPDRRQLESGAVVQRLCVHSSV